MYLDVFIAIYGYLFFIYLYLKTTLQINKIQNNLFIF